MKQVRMWMAMGLALAVVGVACGSGSSSGPAPAAECQPELAVHPAKPVTVSVWAYNSSVDDLASEFNRAQGAVRVNVAHKGDPGETANAYFNAVADHRSLPDMVQLPGFATGAAVDTGSVVPAQACIDAGGYDLADFLPQTLAPTRVAGRQWGMPVGLDDTEILLYDTQAFARAGLDPAHSPATEAELVTAARALAAAGVAHPMGALWALDSLMLAGPVTDADSGHDGRPTRAAFETDAVRQVYRNAYRMIDEGLAVGLPGGPQDDLKAIARHESAMTIHPIADLKDVATALAQGQAPGLSIGVGPVPSAAGPGAILVRSNSLFLTKDSSAAARAGAWSFVTWLEAPERQARGPGSPRGFFFPDRRSAADDPAMVAAFAKEPVLAAAWKVLVDARSVPIPAIGARVLPLLSPVLKAMVDHTAELDDALRQAARATDAELAAYNADPGRYARCSFRPADANGQPARCP